MRLIIEADVSTLEKLAHRLLEVHRDLSTGVTWGVSRYGADDYTFRVEETD